MEVGVADAVVLPEPIVIVAPPTGILANRTGSPLLPAPLVILKA